MLAFARAFPALGINMHHDDLFVGTTAPSRQQVEEQLAQGMQQLQEVVEADLEANFAPHKATVVASDFTLQRRVARRLGRLGARAPTWQRPTLEWTSWQADRSEPSEEAHESTAGSATTGSG